MNILIPDSWLREHLESKATPKQVAQYLSLCSQSVEKIIKSGDDWVYEIEITTNRPDCLAIYGIARELAAILPRFGIKAKLQPLETIEEIRPKKLLPLEVKITNSSLCPRFTALIFDNITIKPSPKIVRNRLEKAGIRALNNVVDITNYLMLELGQPMHTFDYDKIKGAKMILREANKGESIVTLDGINRKLPQGAIIIEDGEKRIIDLCGIMGGENSAVNKNTRRVLLFVQIYDPLKIRQTCQKMAFRTEAAARFEKGVDPEGIIWAIKKAIKMFAKNREVKVASNLIDLYPNPPKPKNVKVSFRLIKEQLGVKISKNDVAQILESLGFEILSQDSKALTARVPSWRAGDVSIPEDIIEEVARIYGYHNLPSLLPTGELPQPSFQKIFYWEEKIKDLLKNWGFTEVYTYSMQSKDLIEETGLNSKRCLKIKNPLTRELEYMRTSLIPSILQVIVQNQDNFEAIKIFELANIYLPRKNQLPEEKLILVGALTGNKFYQAKGILEALLEELSIEKCQFSPLSYKKSKIWHTTRTAEITKGVKFLGVFGEIHPKILANFSIEKRVVVFNLDAVLLFELATTEKTYTPIPKHPSFVEDLCFIVKPKAQIEELIRLIKQVSSIIRSAELIDSFNNQRTIRIFYQHQRRTLTDREVKKVRENIIKEVYKKFGAKIKRE